MRLDRNEGRQKYGLILNRRLAEIEAWDGGEGEALDRRAVLDAIALLERAKVIDWGDKPETEFFAIKLRDINAQAALKCYAGHARQFDPQYSEEVMALAARSGLDHPNCKKPD